MSKPTIFKATLWASATAAFMLTTPCFVSASSLSVDEELLASLNPVDPSIRPEPWCKNLDMNREGESY